MRLLSLLSLVLLLPLSASGNTLWVYPDGGGDYPNIQAAIASAANGDTVLLASGTYTGDGNRDISFLGKALLITSFSGDPDSCILDIQGTQSDQHRGLLFESGEDTSSVLNAVSIANGYMEGDWPDGAGAGIECRDASSPTIRNCRIYGHQGNAGAGLYCFNGASPVLVNCHIIDNVVTESGAGIYCNESSSPTFVGCDVSWNAAAGTGGAIYCKYFCEPTFILCTLSNCTGDAAVRSSYSSPQFHSCTIAENEEDAFRLVYSSPLITNTIVAFNGGVAFSCDSYSFPALECCDVFGNPNGNYSGCASGQLGVNGNLSQDPIFCGHLHSDDQPYTLHALSPCTEENAGECGQMGAWPGNCIPQDFLLLPDGGGDFPNIQEAIDATLPGDSITLADGIFQGDGNRDISIYQGDEFTLRSASNDPLACEINAGGSIEEQHRVMRLDFVPPGEVTIKGVTIAGGYSSAGGGVYLAESSSPLFDNCLFRGNWADNGGALRSSTPASPTFHNCRFEDNHAWGDGGALYLYDADSVSFSHCVFLENSAHNGAALLAAQDGDYRFTNCTFYANHLIGYGGYGAACLMSPACDAVYENCIVVAHDGGEVASGGDAILTCCDVYGNEGGDWVGAFAGFGELNGNLSADPAFCDPDIGDLQLWNYSPCNQYNCGLIGALPVACWDPQGVPIVGELSRGLSLEIAPNPVSASARLAFTIPAGSRGVVEVFDAGGRLVDTIPVRGKAGAVTWDRTGLSGGPAPAGVYYARFMAGEETITRTLVVVR